MSPNEEIAIIGAGHGGCAAAGDFGRQGFRVRLWSRSDHTLAHLRHRGGIELSGEPGEHFVPIPLITNDIGEAVRGARVVMLCVPTQAHGEIAARLAPCLEQGQIVLAAPGHTVLLIPNVLRANGVVRPVVAETATLPYICRMDGPGRIRINRRARALPFAVFPGREMGRVRPVIERFLPAVRPVKNILATVFPYGNAIHHPPATLCNAGRIEATRGDYYHYYDGITPAVGRLIDTLDEERRAVGAALGIDVVPFVENFFRMGYTTEAARDAGIAYEAFHQSGPDRMIRAPGSLDHRFLNEDVPFGLVPLSGLGRFAGVPTPSMDHMIHLASVATGTDFRANGLTLERMGLAGLDRDALTNLLENGFED